MRLRHTVLGRWIVRGTILRPEPALAGDAALKLRADFFTAALFDRIGTTAGK